MKNWSIRFILRLLHPPHIAPSTVLRIPGGNLQTSGWYFCRGRPLTGLAAGFSGTRKFFPFGGASRPGENSGCKGKPDTHHLRRFLLFKGDHLLLPYLYKSLLAATVRRDFSFWSSSSETEKGKPFPFSLLPKYPA